MVKKYFSIILLLISILLLIYTYYRSEVYWNGLKSDYYFVYYFISFSFLIFSIITFFLNEKIKTYTFIVALSIIFSLYFSEIYLISTKKIDPILKKKIKIYKKNTGKDYDTRTLVEVYKNNKKKDVELATTMPTSAYLDNINDKLYSFSGISLSNTLWCNENGYFSMYKSDRYGFNNPDFEWDKEQIDYLLIGDSFAHGACVNRPDDIASRLRLLSGKSVLNLGYFANGPLVEYAVLREYLMKDVKNILWIFYTNDFNDIQNESSSKILKKYLEDKNFLQNLKLRQSEIDEFTKSQIKKNVKRTKIDILSHIKLSEVRTVIYNYLPKKFNPNKSKKFNFLSDIEINNKLEKIFKLSKELANNNGSNLYIVFFPDFGAFNSTIGKEKLLKRKNIVQSMALKLDIPFIDIYEEVFMKENDPLNLFPFKYFGHYNEIGYKKIAEKLFKITKNKK